MHPKPKRIKDDLVLQEFRQGQCVICHKQGVDPCHIKTKGSGGPDADFNLIRMCRQHHTEQHSIGIITMLKKYPILMFVLFSKGWKLDEHNNLQNPKLRTE